MKAQREPGVPNAAQAKTNGSGKWSKYTSRRKSTQVHWGDVSPNSVLEALSVVTDSGDALLFSRSRDGSILGVTLCTGEDRNKIFARTAEEMEAELQELAQAYLD